VADRQQRRRQKLRDAAVEQDIATSDGGSGNGSGSGSGGSNNGTGEAQAELASDSVCSSGTGSDTEWEEGFESSDDEGTRCVVLLGISCRENSFGFVPLEMILHTQKICLLMYVCGV
jgi:hypothetical protein